MVIDVHKGRAVAAHLHEAFRTTGIHGHTGMPEDLLPPSVARGSLEHILFITLTVAIDYQREANALWASARRTFADPETRYLFSPQQLHETEYRKVRSDLQKHGLSKKPGADCHIWRTVGITFFKKWSGDPRNFLADCGWDAPTVLLRLKEGTHVNNGKTVPDYPFLRGPKIGPLWLRMLRDNVGLTEIKNLSEVPIPVDVHVARSTLAMGIVRGNYEGPLPPIYEEIRKAWHESVKGLQIDGRPMIALDVDEPLWHLSKYGCTDRDVNTGECPHFEQCVARSFCIRGKVVVQSGRVLLQT